MRAALLPTALCVFFTACAEDEPARPAPLPDLDWTEVLAFYDVMDRNVAALPVVDGDWADDFGDATFYGTALYARTGEGDAEAALLRAARDHDLALLAEAETSLDFFIDNAHDVIMAALGLIDYVDATGDMGPIAAIDATVDQASALLGLFRDYLPSDGSAPEAVTFYGATTITAAIALLNLQYATYLDTPEADARVQRARRIVTAIDREAWVDAENRYLFAPGDTHLDLYPNVMMMLVLCRLHERTGERAWLTRAVDVFDAMAPLRREAGNYYSAYSAEEQGATTEDYSTLSSQNYLTLALLLLWQDTRDARYLVEAKGVLDFVRTHLYEASTGRLLHHWIDGRVALPTDPEFFCAGCNLQFLYVGWYLRERVLAAG